MELLCEKYQERMDSADCRCRHLQEYCKHRTSCMIQFMSSADRGATAAPALRFDKNNGLVPVIVQDNASGEILMLAYCNQEAWRCTLETGKAHYWSRSRNKIWLKGETSGHVQIVKEIYVDCDDDTVVLRVEQLGGAACHTGHRSCFYRRLENGKLIETGEKVFDPREVYKK